MTSLMEFMIKWILLVALRNEEMIKFGLNFFSAFLGKFGAQQRKEGGTEIPSWRSGREVGTGQ